MTASARVRRRIQSGRIPIRFFAEGKECVGYLRNISKAGVFIFSDDIPRRGCPLAIQFESPDGRLVNLKGEVRWRTLELFNSNVAPGFGVLLREPTQAFREFFLLAEDQYEKEGDEKAD
ncbi:MAG: hypothetical protein GY725_26780 [bacterium]|nr:hypothetical protein [bacterium]